MSLTRTLSFLVLVITFALLSIACSKGISPTEPVTDNVPESIGTLSEGRNILAVYECIIDPVPEIFNIEPITRRGEYHFPLTSMYPNVLQITGVGFTPNLWADIKLEHPFPGSGIDAFDPRVIAVLPANPGVSTNYPDQYVFANNSVLLEPDGYTKMHDILNVIGNANPFVLYFKDEPYRVWSSFYTTEETKRWEMDISGFGGPLSYKLIVDVSTNFPSPPQHIVDNSPEPVQLNAMVSGGLRDDGGSADIEVTVQDWQGIADIGGVLIEAPDLFTGTVGLTYQEPGPNPNEYLFTGTISNDLLASAGNYNALIAAWDDPGNIYTYIEVDVYVDEVLSFRPLDITPNGLDGFRATEVFVVGDLAYVSGGSELQIIDIDLPGSAYIVKTVSTKGEAWDVYVYEGYAYVADGSFGLQIIDVTPPQSAFVFNTVDTPGLAKAVHVSRDYAYVADQDSGLQIIDIDPPGNEQIVGEVDTPHVAKDVCLYNGYAYIADGNSIQIIDILPVGSEHVVSTIDTPGVSEGVYATNGYAYVAENTSGIRIIVSDPPESAYFLKRLNLDGYCENVFVSGGIAYLACWGDGIRIIDVDPPDAPYLAGTGDTEGLAFGVHVIDNIAYVADYDSGLSIIQLN